MPSAKPSLKQMAKEAAEKKSKSASQKTGSKKDSKKPSHPVLTSAEFIQESDDEESSVESESEAEKSTTKPTKSTPTTNGKPVAPVDSSSESESGSGSEESSSEEEDEDEEMADTGTAEEAGDGSVEKSAGITVAPKTARYKAPTGFERSKVDGNPEAAQMFAKSNLKGKQIWYFTAPASVPISEIKTMSLQDAKDGNPILKHNEGNYAFLQDSTEDKTYTKIMVPNSAEHGYTTSAKSVDQVFHLQQIVKLDGVVDDAPTKNHSCGRLSKPGRSQPKGLKIRFRPLGFGDGDLGRIGSDSDGKNDEEMEDAPAPEPKKSSSDKSLKRKHSEGKEKKSKHSSSDTTKIPQNKKLKRSKKTKTESQTSTQDSQSASTNVPDSSTHRRPETAIPLPNSSSALRAESDRVEATQKSSKKRHHKSTTPEPIAKNDSVKAKISELTKKEAKKLKKLKKAKREGNDSQS